MVLGTLVPKGFMMIDAKQFLEDYCQNVCQWIEKVENNKTVESFGLPFLKVQSHSVERKSLEPQGVS